MGSTWKCSAGALQLPSAGLHGHQAVLGLGEGHNLTSSSHSARINAHTNSCRVRFSFGSFGILASRRIIRNDVERPKTEFEKYLGSSSMHKCLFSPGCASIGWSQRFPFTATHAHDNNSSKSISSPRFDNEEEEDLDYAEKRRGANAFQDFGKHTDGDEPFVNGEYMRLSRGDSDDSQLFREEGDSQKDSVWADAGRGEDDEDSDGSANSARSDGYESWESENSTESGASSSVGSAADSLAIGGKEPVYKVRRAAFNAMLLILTKKN